ncbi:hypothetical protein AC249_AIPGENE10737 [Exaiptasia diaphana]|nr:hypothetical protein AC249_AIPGENE10737 [Exaiptasia diaphana]
MPSGQKLLSWVCSEDQDDMFVCEQGRLSCRTKAHDDSIINWKFDCGSRDGPHRNIHFHSPDFAGFAHAIAIGVPLLSEAGAKWLSTLMTNIEKQFKPDA